jgi:hypothetical protein
VFHGSRHLAIWQLASADLNTEGRVATAAPHSVASNWHRSVEPARGRPVTPTNLALMVLDATRTLSGLIDNSN